MKNRITCRASATTLACLVAAAALGLAEPPTTQPAAAPTTQPATAPTTQPATATQTTEENPPAEDFDLAGSDSKAIEIADEVMQALGGRKAWDETRYITWRFFGGTRHVWDKHTGMVRTELEDKALGSGLAIIIHNINTRQGQAWRHGKPITNDVELPSLVDGAYRSFINDSYWMFMPYKLKDSGVTLKYNGDGETQDGAAADVLTLTFKDVGVTPRNKYDIYVGKASRLVEQWSFYRRADDDEPRMTAPWKEWKRFGRIMLAESRGSMRAREEATEPRELRMSEIAVYDALPAKVFSSPEPFDPVAPGNGP